MSIARIDVVEIIDTQSEIIRRQSLLIDKLFKCVEQSEQFREESAKIDSLLSKLATENP